MLVVSVTLGTCVCCVQRWDRSHLLENLSGYETSCAMIGKDDWQFTKVREREAETGQRLTALFGWAENQGSTDEALYRILEDFKEVPVASQLTDPHDTRQPQTILKLQS